MTGGGVHWMFQKGNVNIFDISKTQVAFIDSLLQNWDGENYGQFVYNFITKNKVLHFHVNLNEEQNSNKDLILNKNEFITKINENFEMLKNKYDPNWQWNPENVKVNNGDLISQLSTVYLGKALVSNIFDFKYYFVKCYVDDAYKLLSPSTRSFIQQNTHLNINTNNPACKKVELGVPASDIYEEIQNIKKAPSAESVYTKSSQVFFAFNMQAPNLEKSLSGKSTNFTKNYGMSGVYGVLAIESRFSGGKFEQTLSSARIADIDISKTKIYSMD